MVVLSEADERNHQETCVEPLGAVGLHKAVEVAVETALTDFRKDFVGDLAPPPCRIVQSFSFHFIRRAIERDPSHDLRMNLAYPVCCQYDELVIICRSGLPRLSNNASRFSAGFSR